MVLVVTTTSLPDFLVGVYNVDYFLLGVYDSDYLFFCVYDFDYLTFATSWRTARIRHRSPDGTDLPALGGATPVKSPGTCNQRRYTNGDMWHPDFCHASQAPQDC